MAFYCRVERDSVTPTGDRLTTFVITFPRSVLAEATTHRANYDTWGGEVTVCERTTTPDISKNSASSRAIPFMRMVEAVRNDPYMPEWTLNQKGMQGIAEDDPGSIAAMNEDWLDAMAEMIHAARKLHGRGVHKQDCNRLLEPFAWVTQVVTSAAWDNFFTLRCHHMAHPAIRRIARMMYLSRRESTPAVLDYGQWHLPFVPAVDAAAFRYEPGFILAPESAHLMPDFLKHSAARCAWVSYENHDRDATPEAHDRTFSRLFADDVSHLSPLEHQATPMRVGLKTARPELVSNLRGWLQARKLIAAECINRYEPSDEEVASWGITDPMTGH